MLEEHVLLKEKDVLVSQEFDNLVVLYYRLKQKPTPPQKEVG